MKVANPHYVVTHEDYVRLHSSSLLYSTYIYVVVFFTHMHRVACFTRLSFPPITESCVPLVARGQRERHFVSLRREGFLFLFADVRKEAQLHNCVPRVGRCLTRKSGPVGSPKLAPRAFVCWWEIQAGYVCSSAFCFFVGPGFEFPKGKTNPVTFFQRTPAEERFNSVVFAES